MMAAAFAAGLTTACWCSASALGTLRGTAGCAGVETTAGKVKPGPRPEQIEFADRE